MDPFDEYRIRELRSVREGEREANYNEGFRAGWKEALRFVREALLKEEGSSNGVPA